MTIDWQGLSFFKINDGSISLWIDPVDNKTYDIKPSEDTPDVCLLSNPDFLKYDKNTINKTKYTFTYPGEYEVQDISIQVHSSAGPDKTMNNIFVIHWNGSTLVHMGTIRQKSSVGKLLEKIDGVDVLMIPVGGKSVLEATDAVEIVHQIEPAIVIPMFYKTDADHDDKMGLSNADYFIQEIGQEKEELDKLKLEPEKLNREKTKLVILRKA
ncbi:MAG: MBL fold metallo-hydrolase [Candidatus Paceibacterota bacterium]|jgi:hypothetical protein